MAVYAERLGPVMFREECCMDVKVECKMVLDQVLARPAHVKWIPWIVSMACAIRYRAILTSNQSDVSASEEPLWEYQIVEDLHGRGALERNPKHRHLTAQA